jgi:hydrogenase expression/formation protein HypC
MCLSIPARIESIDGEMAVVNVGGVEYNASLQMVEDVKIGDYVLLHTGFAIQKISDEEARETFKLLNELEEIDRQIDQEEKK